MAAVAEATLPIWFSEATRAKRPAIVEAARAMIVGTSEAGYLGASKALQRLDYKRRLPGDPLPDACSWSARRTDRIRRRCASMAALVPGAEFVELADAAHISNLEQPERFTETVLRFLSGALIARMRSR